MELKKNEDGRFILYSVAYVDGKRHRLSSLRETV